MMPPFRDRIRTRAAVLGVLLAAVAAVIPARASAQTSDPDLQIFGYFQTRFSVEKQIESSEKQSTFTVQQLNVFLRRPINARWTSFVDFEVVNSFSSERGWGGFDLDEAWVSYRRGPGLTVKAGLLIPRFNQFNEIKNRMPLHPYIIRPLVYESSFSELVGVDEYVPQRAYVQAQGSRRANAVRVDYAAYVGNSRHINANVFSDFTGVDTTDYFMGGGRVGVRHRDTIAGVSFTAEKVNLEDFYPGAADSLGVSPSDFHGVLFTRFGADFSTRYRGASLESEYISAVYHEDIAHFNINKKFWYATLGYLVAERWFFYATYWDTRENYWFTFLDDVDQTFKIYGGGISCAVNDRVTCKGQFGVGKHETTVPGFDLSPNDFYHSSLAVSVFF